MPAPTAVEFAKWPLIRDALLQVRAVQGDRAHRAMVQRLVDGLVVAWAAESVVGGQQTKSAVPVPSEVWAHYSNSTYLTAESFWTTNDIDVSFFPPGRGYKTQYRFYEVRLDPDGVARMAPPKPAPQGAITLREGGGITLRSSVTPPAPALLPAPGVSLAPSRAGRPRKDFWDDLLIATAKAIFEGQLQAKTYADVERWMADWASANGHEIGDTALKAPAKKLFLALCE